jgi:N-acyl-phosphatidylethanolamine-hydrolysing phospholipase D
MGTGNRFFFSGDTGYFSAFKEIGDRLGPFDLAAIPIGAYMPREIMRMTHLTPEAALQVFVDLQGKRLLGIYWGTFDLTEEPFDEPPARLQAKAQRRGLDPEAIWLLNPGRHPAVVSPTGLIQECMIKWAGLPVFGSF